MFTYLNGLGGCIIDANCLSVNVDEGITNRGLTGAVGRRHGGSLQVVKYGKRGKNPRIRQELTDYCITDAVTGSVVSSVWHLERIRHGAFLMN